MDKVHVIEFRALQNAGWVVGFLAWPLGNNEFVPRDQLSTCMGIHVTLTGVRRAFAPFLGMAVYLGWDAKDYVPGSADQRLLVPVVGAAVGDRMARLLPFVQGYAGAAAEQSRGIAGQQTAHGHALPDRGRP